MTFSKAGRRRGSLVSTYVPSSAKALALRAASLQATQYHALLMSSCITFLGMNVLTGLDLQMRPCKRYMHVGWAPGQAVEL